MMQLDKDTMLTIINATISIMGRHRGSSVPVTAESVHAEMMAEIQDGKSKIAKEFAAKGVALPDSQ